METYKIVLITIAVFVGFIILAYMLIGLYFFNRMFKRKENSLLGSTKNRSKQRLEIINPMRMDAIQKLENISFEVLSIMSDDGLKLTGRLYKTTSKQCKGLIYCLHGFNSNPLRVYAYITPYLLEDGWDCLLVSARAHADSEGKWSGFSCLEQEDVRCWLIKLVQQYKTIYLYGQSMGAATMALAASKTLPPQVKGVIFDCGFSAPIDVILSKVPSKAKALSYPMFIFADMFARMIGHFSFLSKKNQAKNTIQNAKVPFLFIHGDSDEVVPVEEGYIMDKVCPTPHTLNIFTGAEHMASIYLEPDRYLSLVKNFINQ